MATTLREYPDPNECADRLLNLALRGGGPDNITLIIADVTDKTVIEEAPIVGGAAAQNGGRPDATESSRASALSPRRKAAAKPAKPSATPTPLADPAADDEDDPRRHPGRTALLLVL